MKKKDKYDQKVKVIVTVVLAVICMLFTTINPVSAAGKKGTYEKVFYSKGEPSAFFNVVINEISGNKIRFQISYSSTNMHGSMSNVIDAKIKGKKVKFNYTEDILLDICKGKGVMKLKRNSITIKTKSSSGLVNTNGKIYKLKWKNGTTELYG